jgi:hypothetical protein
MLSTARVQQGSSDSLCLSWREWPRLPFTARIERAPSHRARSASKKGTWPLPLILLRPRVARARRAPSRSRLLGLNNNIDICRHTIRPLLVRHPQLEPVGPFL